MRVINENTKISELVKENPESVPAIASLAKPLEKLKNPILRKIMASRVTIAEAAKMGGVTVADFQRVLQPLGFQFENGMPATPEATQKQPKPAWLQTAAPESIDYYDVRPIIDDGSDPLKMILSRFKDTPDGGILCIINNFIPTPLIHLLQQEKAEDAYVQTIHPKEHHTFFLKKNKATTDHTAMPPADEKLHFEDEASFLALKNQFPADQCKEIDVRALPMPEPMHTILAELDRLPAGHALYVNHKRVPVYLLEELADRAYNIHIWKIEEGDVKMLIFAR